MTSDEIKKALGHCEFDNCSGCPLAGIGECYNIAVKEALNYINQLESEVESITEKFECQQQVYADLSKIIKNQRTEIDGLKTRNINNCRHWQKKYSSLRAEAVKDFAKKLKCGVPQDTGVIRCKDVDFSLGERLRESLCRTEKIL